MSFGDRLSFADCVLQGFGLPCDNCLQEIGKHRYSRQGTRLQCFCGTEWRQVGETSDTERLKISGEPDGMCGFVSTGLVFQKHLWNRQRIVKWLGEHSLEVPDLRETEDAWLAVHHKSMGAKDSLSVQIDPGVFTVLVPTYATLSPMETAAHVCVVKSLRPGGGTYRIEKSSEGISAVETPVRIEGVLLSLPHGHEHRIDAVAKTGKISIASQSGHDHEHALSFVAVEEGPVEVHFSSEEKSEHDRYGHSHIFRGTVTKVGPDDPGQEG